MAMSSSTQNFCGTSNIPNYASTDSLGGGGGGVEVVDDVVESSSLNFYSHIIREDTEAT